MKIADLRAKTRDELMEQVQALKKEQFNLRLQKTLGQLASTSRIREARRTIAQIKTILSEQTRKAVSSVRKGK